MSKRKRILVADDAPFLLAVIKDILECGGYEVIAASDGLEALTKARAERPDAIVLDVEMPKMQGYHVCRMLKFDERYKHIPIIILTSKAEEKDKLIGLKTGADEYLTKPVGDTVLLEAIKEILKLKSQIR